jgi:hypothetical protein
VSGGVDTFGGNTPLLTIGDTKIAFAYKIDNAGVSVNGSAVTTDSSVILPLGISQMTIGSTGVPSQFLNSTIKKIAYHSQRLTNAELQTLTRN